MPPSPWIDVVAELAEDQVVGLRRRRGSRCRSCRRRRCPVGRSRGSVRASRRSRPCTRPTTVRAVPGVAVSRQFCAMPSTSSSAARVLGRRRHRRRRPRRAVGAAVEQRAAERLEAAARDVARPVMSSDVRRRGESGRLSPKTRSSASSPSSHVVAGAADDARRGRGCRRSTSSLPFWKLRRLDRGGSTTSSRRLDLLQARRRAGSGRRPAG